MLIDTMNKTITFNDGDKIDLDSPEGFRNLSELWVRCGISQKYSYGFSWLGRPIIQMPDDLVRVQEVITQVKPNIIIETGVAHGGSLVYYASLLKLLHPGAEDTGKFLKVNGCLAIGVDREVREENFQEINRLRSKYKLPLHIIEGDSVAPEVIAKIKRVMSVVRYHKFGPIHALVVLDSNHSYEHVLDELRAYSQFVTPGSYIVVTDGIIEEWSEDNPARAARQFAAENSNCWEIVEPKWPFNESNLTHRVTGWPGCFLKRKV